MLRDMINEVFVGIRGNNGCKCWNDMRGGKIITDMWKEEEVEHMFALNFQINIVIDSKVAM